MNVCRIFRTVQLDACDDEIIELLTRRMGIIGEEYFRNLETNLLIELSKKNQLVVSCGGGTALRQTAALRQ